MAWRVNDNNLTVRQQLFADEYIISLNATQAAIKAGYSNKTAKQIGSKLLTEIDVALYIDNTLKNIQNSKIATATEVEMYLTSAIRNELTEEVIIFNHEGEAITKTKGLAGKEKIKAAELMAKRHGLLTDKIDMQVQGSIVIDANDED